MLMKRLDSKQARLEARWIPKGYLPAYAHETGAAAYVSDPSPEAVRKTYTAMAFWGTAAKPLWHYSYRTVAERDAAIEKFKSSYEGSLTAKAEKSAAAREWVNTIKPGDLFSTSWGYDQTNVDFYGVTRVSGKRVWVRPVAGDLEQTGFMSGKTKVSSPVTFLEPLERYPETMHVARAGYKGEPSLTIKGHSASRTTTEETHYESWYA